jgi:hypothetical protein
MRSDDVPLSAVEKIRLCLGMHEEGVALQRLALQRRYPDKSAHELARLLQDWLERKDEA